MPSADSRSFVYQRHLIDALGERRGDADGCEGGFQTFRPFGFTTEDDHFSRIHALDKPGERGDRQRWVIGKGEYSAFERHIHSDSLAEKCGNFIVWFFRFTATSQWMLVALAIRRGLRGPIHQDAKPASGKGRADAAERNGPPDQRRVYRGSSEDCERRIKDITPNNREVSDAHVVPELSAQGDCFPPRPAG